MGFIASAFLSAYMAMTGMTADVPQRNAPDLSEKTVAAASVETNATGGRRRAVRHPGNPNAPLDAQFMSAPATTLTVTNYDTVPATIKACMNTCADYTVAPSATMRADVSGLGNDRLTLKTNTTSIDATTEKGNMQRTSDFSTSQIVPTGDLTKFYQETLLLATQTGSATMTVRNNNGLIAYTHTQAYTPGITVVPQFFAQEMTGRHIEVSSTTPVGTIARIKNATTTIDVAGTNKTATAFYMPHASGEPFGVIANATETPTNTSFSFHQENGNTFSSGNYELAPHTNTHFVNMIASTAGGFGSGTIIITGTKPISAFAMTPLVTIDEAANGKTGLVDDNTTAYSVVFQNGKRIDLAEASSFPANITGSVTAYNGTTTVGKKDFTLPPNGTASVDVSDLAGERYMVSVNKPNDTSNLLPRLVATSTDGTTTWKGYKTPTPAAKVTGEEYVAKWLDTLKDQYFYLSNNEVRCMINGNCGTRSYAPDIAVVMASAAENTTGKPPSQYEQSLKNWTDGDATNAELYRGFDPMSISMVNKAFGFNAGATGQNTLIYNLTQTNVDKLYTAVRTFLSEYATANPIAYGGTNVTGPSLDHNPTWSTQDTNN